MVLSFLRDFLRVLVLLISAVVVAAPELPSPLRATAALAGSLSALSLAFRKADP